MRIFLTCEEGLLGDGDYLFDELGIMPKAYNERAELFGMREFITLVEFLAFLTGELSNMTFSLYHEDVIIYETNEKVKNALVINIADWVYA